MPLNQVGNSLSVSDKRFNPNSATSPVSSTAHNSTKDNAALDAQLTTLNGAYYTAARLQTLSLNDKIYHVRVGYDNAGI